MSNSKKLTLDDICTPYVMHQGTSIISSMIEKNENLMSKEREFFDSSLKGEIEKVRALINKGYRFWTMGLYGACVGNHPKIIALMLDRDSTKNTVIVGMCGGCVGGHIEIVKMMIEKGADAWNQGLYIACKYGHADIAKLMIEKGANDMKGAADSVREGIKTSGKSIPGHQEIIVFITEYLKKFL